MARGRPKKASDRFEDERKLDTLESLDTRFEDRSFNSKGIRQDFQMGVKHILQVNEALIPDDVAYKWGTLSIRGQEDHSAMIEYAREGWMPVPLKRHPEFWIDERIPGAEAIMKSGLIIVKGAILLQRSKAECERAVKQVREENARSLDRANWMEKPNGLLPVGMNPQLTRDNLTLSRNRSFN